MAGAQAKNRNEKKGAVKPRRAKPPTNSPAGVTAVANLVNAELERAEAALADSETRKRDTSAVTDDYVIATIHEIVERAMDAVEVRDSSGRVLPGIWGYDPKSALRGCELLGKKLGLFTDKDSAQLKQNVQPVLNVKLYRKSTQ